ncbi:acetyltransferase [Desulfonauticus submarinus]|uniref:Acetyltransferase n=1 Tax=Desulfonauticus submarinus TaxID=206665 RepID=A0A1H0AEP0_9BACT|nr:acetate--CoA ligase family protein [Desulfonauticus submarinus]SDN31794.1 acetyltransferase [Desulfonauticus submarinus]
MKQNLEYLFSPKSIAIIGASSHPEKIGHIVLQNLQEMNFKGEIYPVNPKAKTILGLPVFSDIKSLPKKIDLAVITVPRGLAVKSVEELGEKGVKAVIVISAGFKEIGGKGYHQEQKLIEIAKKYNIALLGPNCLGLINTHANLNTTFATGIPNKGNISFFSQSGALCVAILDWALGENIGFSKFISLGNKAILDETDMIEYLGKDPKTKVILGYIENVCSGEKFIQTAKKVTRNKPILLIKSGRTAAGARAASSHTGAIAGSDKAYSTAFSKAGIIRVFDVETLFNLALAFSTQPLPQGPNLTIITNSGGPGIMAADICENSKLQMTRLSAETIQKLKQILPGYAALYNPIDIIGDADAKRYLDTIDVIVDDPNTHAILVLLSPTSAIAPQITELAKGIVKKCKNIPKPIFCVFMGKHHVKKGQKILLDNNIPCYLFPEPAIRSLETMYKHWEWTKKGEIKIEIPKRNLELAKKVINEAIVTKQREIVEFQALKILQAYNLPHPKTKLARSSDEAMHIAEEIGFPVVLKIASPSISHKTDVKGVIINLNSPKEVKNAFLEITSRAQRLRPEAHITGCLVQKMAPKGCKEVIVGFKRDDQFGPLIMFGLGGIYVEVLKDISFGLAPLTRDDAQNMIRQIKSYLLLKGFRGEPPVNFKAIEDIILIMSQLSLDLPEVFEAEFNPVLVNDKEALVADVRLIISANNNKKN